MKNLLAFCLFLLFINAFAQKTFPINGVKDERPAIYAFTNASIHIDYQSFAENATLVLQDGKVLAAGVGVKIPKGAIVIDLKGKHIYPALIDPYTNYGVANIDPNLSSSSKIQYDSERKEAYGWNDHVKSDYRAVNDFAVNKAEAAEWKKLGYGTVLSFRSSGLVRGTSLVATLADAPANEVIIKANASSHFSFLKGQINQLYPKSIMGSVALIRQTYMDADWYKANPDLEYNLTLEAFNENRKLPQVFEANGDKLRLLLVDKIGDEFGVQYIIKGNGDEYQRIQEVKATNAPLILPLNFPLTYDVSDPIAAYDVSLAEMKHWEMAPYNAKLLSDAGVSFAFTASDLKNKSELWDVLQKLAETGLSKSEILKATTYTPASYYQVEKQVGALKKDMLANFFISSGDMFDKESKIIETWVQGERNKFSDIDEPNYAGKYKLTLDTSSFVLELVKIETGHSAVIHNRDSTILPVNFKLKDANVQMDFAKDSTTTRLSGWAGKTSFGGIGTNSMGLSIKWAALKMESDSMAKADQKVPEAKPVKSLETGKLMYPFVAHGWTEKPKQETILFKNATVWTMESDSYLENSDVLVANGKIAKVGKDLVADGAKIIDAKGKHLTPGIIDEHSHIALSAVNEGSLAVTSEVRMYDAVNSEDIKIYQNLAGGVVAAQLLHGSANPVGGQSALVKFRWGLTPDQMKIEGADGFIKFALGENVKQSNWGDQYKERFPQTRMGVEQVYIESFTRAREYGDAKAKYEGLNKKEKAKTPAPRTDLRLDALLEIINKERFITCHSYVQSEINMLMKVAEQFDFSINTFTHILEGYKVADKMKEHGVGASTFSDWWAYKFEVKDAIPYNASLMAQAGLVVAINSDDGEMSRRLNQEAAKSVKYGGMSEVEALKMITLNPAKLLHLDDRMGSIKIGKDADLVLWSDHPLSIYAKAEYTLVDGIIYFSLEKDLEAREFITSERTRLINKMLAAKAGGSPTQAPQKKENELLHCDEMEINGFIQNAQNHD